MRILLTNDDGVYADGLQTLRQRLEQEGRHQLLVAAPERERSAMSHAITLHKPLHVLKVTVEGATSPIWSVNGTPADCTKLGAQALMPSPPDLVISGINRGANAGMDTVIYSGTVSAAFEAYILGLPALAVSLDAHEDPDYRTAAEVTAQIVARIEQLQLTPPYLLNVNVPAVEWERLGGMAVTRLGLRYFDDVFQRGHDPRGRAYYWLSGIPRKEKSAEGTDVWALAHNLVSITPLHLNLTEHRLFDPLESLVADINRQL